MSFLKKLFGGGKAEEVAAVAPSQQYKGYVIRATPFKDKERFQVCGVIAKEIDGEIRENTFIRADSSPMRDDAVEMTFFKARQIIDQGGGDLPG
jgi:hypothetical protein